MSAAPPYSPPAGHAAPNEITVVSHSNLFYWWPVWAVGFLLALLIAETGNLLLLRPPRSTAARDLWMQRAMDLRAAAGKVARAAGTRDYDGSRAALAGLANACNRCHSTFRVPVRIGPRAEEGEAPPKEPAPKDSDRPAE